MIVKVIATDNVMIVLVAFYKKKGGKNELLKRRSRHNDMKVRGCSAFNGKEHLSVSRPANTHSFSLICKNRYGSVSVMLNYV